MLIKTSEGDKNVSSKGLGGTALGLAIGGLGLSVLNSAAEVGGRGILGGFIGGRRFGRGDDYGCECEGLKPVMRPWQYEDEINFLKVDLITNKKVDCLEEKVERMFVPVFEQLKRLEIKTAVDEAVENQRNKDYAIIDKQRYIIDQLEDEKNVKKLYYQPCGSRLVSCCDNDDKGCGGCDRR